MNPTTNTAKIFTQDVIELVMALAEAPAVFTVGACEHRILIKAPSKLAAVIYYGKEIAKFAFGTEGFCGHLFAVDGKEYNGPDPWYKFTAGVYTYEGFKAKYGKELEPVCSVLEDQLARTKSGNEWIVMTPTD